MAQHRRQKWNVRFFHRILHFSKGTQTRVKLSSHSLNEARGPGTATTGGGSLIGELRRLDGGQDALGLPRLIPQVRVGVDVVDVGKAVLGVVDGLVRAASEGGERRDEEGAAEDDGQSDGHSERLGDGDDAQADQQAPDLVGVVDFEHGQTLEDVVDLDVGRAGEGVQRVLDEVPAAAPG